MSSEPPSPPSPWPRLIAAVVLLALAWLVRESLVLLFGAALVAALLNLLCEPLCKLGIARRLAVVSVALAIATVVGVGLWQLGDPLAEQLQGLQQTVPQAWHALQGWLSASGWGRHVLEWFRTWQSGPGTAGVISGISGIAGLASAAVAALGSLALIAVIGFFLALDLPHYRNGLAHLLPPARRPRIMAAVDASGQTLSRWLLGQALLMLIVGVATAVGLMLMGVPMPLALGVIAGVLEFVPFFGPIASGLLAVLVAFSQGPSQALYVAVFFVVLQQVEGNVLVPVIQRRTVQLLPVLGLMGVLVFGTLFGVLGVVFGTPLMVVAMVLVRRLYVQIHVRTLPDEDEGADSVAG